MQLKKPAIAIAMASALALTACGGGGGEGGDEPEFQEGGAAGSGKDATIEGPKALPEDAADGGTLTVLTEEGPATFDPTRAYYTDSTAILDLVTRSLTQYVYDPETNDAKLIPDLATDLGTPNEDNTEWTFTLREGIKYEDGSEVTPEDVAYSVKRSFAIDELPDGPVYQTEFFLDGDTYKGPYKDGTDYAGVEVDGQDITIKMAKPFPEMDYYASFPLFTPIPEAKDTKAQYGNHPLATGPYKFEDYKPGTSLTLVKNDQWDADTDPGRIQAVDGFDFKFGEDSARLQNTIVDDQGSAQTTFTYDNISPATLRKIQETDESRLTTGTSPCTYLWYLDMRKITDINVRKAIGYAYPYRAAWRAAGEIEGVTREPGTTILPPGTAGRQDFDPLGNGGVETDPERARELLEEADAVGYEIKWLYERDTAESVAAKDEVVAALEEAGFKPTPIASTAATIRDELNDPSHEINIHSQGWCSDWPSGGSWFPAQWDGRLINESSVSNPSFLDDEAVNAEIDDILTNAEADEVADRWGELDKMIMEDIYPAVNVGYSGTAMIRGSQVGGFLNDPIRGMPTLKDMYIIE